MGNAEETHELIGKTGSGNTLDGAAEDVAAVERRGRRRLRSLRFLLNQNRPACQHGARTRQLLYKELLGLFL